MTQQDVTQQAISEVIKISIHRHIDRPLILDLSVTKSAKFILAMLSYKDDKILYKVFDEILDLESNAPEFINYCLTQFEEANSIITDCSIGYLPTVVKTISEKQLRQLGHIPLFSNDMTNTEKVMLALSRQY